MDELRLACKLVLLGTVYFSPLIVPSTVIIYLFMRRGPQRLAVLSRKRVATLAIVAAIPLAFVVNFRMPDGYQARMYYLAALIDECGVRDGPLLWLRNFDDPESSLGWGWSSRDVCPPPGE